MQFSKAEKVAKTIKETSNSNHCLSKALAIGVALFERKDSCYKHLPRVESETAEKRQLPYRMKRFDGIDGESVSSNRYTMDDLPFLVASSFWEEHMVTLFDRNFMGLYIKSLIDGKDKHIDLFYDRQLYHVYVSSSTTGLFMVRY